MARTKKSSEEPTVVVGSHLTVYTYPNGKKKLEWDDEALRRDVLEALASVSAEKKPAVKAKTVRKKKGTDA
jgi:hypothetical protein